VFFLENEKKRKEYFMEYELPNCKKGDVSFVLSRYIDGLDLLTKRLYFCYWYFGLDGRLQNWTDQRGGVQI